MYSDFSLFLPFSLRQDNTHKTSSFHQTSIIILTDCVKDIRVIGSVGTPLLVIFTIARTALYIYMQKQALYPSPTRPDTLGGNLPPPVWMSPVAACRVTSGELPPPPPDDFRTQLCATASSSLGWLSTHISDRGNHGTGSCRTKREMRCGLRPATRRRGSIGLDKRWCMVPENCNRAKRQKVREQAIFEARFRKRPSGSYEPRGCGLAFKRVDAHLV